MKQQIFIFPVAWPAQQWFEPKIPGFKVDRLEENIQVIFAASHKLAFIYFSYVLQSFILNIFR